MTYEESLKQLEDIVRKMEAGEFSIYQSMQGETE